MVQQTVKQQHDARTNNLSTNYMPLKALMTFNAFLCSTCSSTSVRRGVQLFFKGLSGCVALALLSGCSSFQPGLAGWAGEGMQQSAVHQRIERMMSNAAKQRQVDYVPVDEMRDKRQLARSILRQQFDNDWFTTDSPAPAVRLD